MEITTEEQYKSIMERLNKGEVEIEKAGGFLKAPKSWTKEYQILAEACLKYEIENDLLPF